MVTTNAVLDVIARDGRALVAAAASEWARPVPDCPDWDAAGLVRHTGGILAWMARIVETGERTSFRSLPPPPEEDAELAAWFLENLERTLTVMRNGDPDRTVWTFSSLGDHRASWWWRRLGVEMAIHRWDAEYAVAIADGPTPRPLDSAVAMAGIEEFVAEFLPGLLAQPAAERPSGTLRLHITDVMTDRWLDLDDQGTDLIGPTEVDTTVRGTASAVLLWLTNRHTDAVVAGDRSLLDAWTALKR
ncbi:maleylpyruvate isomerase family mycothiol-dependent enzyme [Mycobacterium sp. EPa45]|uniref:maleylpyruvate isomerase family mycothiol-dependent enzyme n=1 Tax=Mycobacterium sp. EPa45 TaxID=1545728 RepID=UPI000641D31D|nr:maleylpyruvate isomerase family mycothiol-dependent enzyme [Mycobacterium sp. EPa45]AKK26069.1 hypothetical protein AB431_04440 [Mycobacterium sp. EPa45]